MSKKIIEINLKKISIVLFVIGVIYLILGITISTLWEYFEADEWGIVMIVEGVIFNMLASASMIKHLLPPKNVFICLLIGCLTAYIGVILAVIIKKSNNKKEVNKDDKYENLEKLQKLKEQGTITQEEFEIEKKKILG